MDLNSLANLQELFFEHYVPNLLALEPVYVLLTIAVFAMLIVFVLLLFKVARWIIALIKSILLLALIVVSGYLFVTSFYDKLSIEALTTMPLQTLLMGALGGIVLLLSLVVAILSLKRTAKKRPEPAPEIEPTTIQQPKMLTTQALKNQLRNDRSLLAVLSYVIIAEFGIFSSKTFPAPNPQTGFAFFLVFFIGAFIFIKTSYKSYVRGVAHLLVALTFAFTLSIFLGHFWALIPLETLLSFNYFGTTAMVAVITAIAVSLLMGSRSV